MMKPVINYHGLLGPLQTFKKDHQLHKGLVNLVEGSSVGHHFSKKGMKRKKKNKKVLSAGPSQTKKKRVDKNQA